MNNLITALLLVMFSSAAVADRYYNEEDMGTLPGWLLIPFIILVLFKIIKDKFQGRD
jgi:hypothetical protein